MRSVELAAYCRERGVPLTAYSPLARGRVNGEPLLREIADGHGCSPARVTLAWTLQRGHLAIPKASGPVHLRDNLAALDLALTAEEMSAVSVHGRPGGTPLAAPASRAPGPTGPVRSAPTREDPTLISARLVEAFRFDVGSAPDPEPGPDELLVRVEGCGVCGSNLPPWRGARGTGFPLDPGAPGHEAWGRVEAVGEGSSELLGRRVAMLSYRAFAELDLVRHGRVLPLPDTLTDVDVLGEPLACAVNVAERSGVRAGDTVVVVGIGFLGALLLALLREAEPGRLIAVSRRATSREMAERMGAEEVLHYEEAADLLGADEQDGFADVVVECTGEQAPLDLAARLCRVRGRLVVAGYHQDGPRSVDMRLWNWRGLDVINAHERDPLRYVDGMRGALDRIVDGTLDPAPLITHRLPLTEIQRAFESADRRENGFFKAVVLPGEEG